MDSTNVSMILKECKPSGKSQVKCLIYARYHFHNIFFKDKIVRTNQWLQDTVIVGKTNYQESQRNF